MNSSDVGWFETLASKKQDYRNDAHSKCLLLSRLSGLCAFLETSVLYRHRFLLSALAKYAIEFINRDHGSKTVLEAIEKYIEFFEMSLERFRNDKTYRAALDFLLQLYISTIQQVLLNVSDVRLWFNRSECDGTKYCMA